MKNIFQTSLLSATLLGVLLSSTTHAAIGQVLFDSRMDFQSFSSNTAAGKPAYSAFRLNRMRLDMQGTLGVDTSFRIRLDFLNSIDTPTTRDRTSKLIEFAYISRSLNDNMNLVVGKYITEMGGVEGANSTADIYLRSVAGDEIGRIYYPVGAQLDTTLDKNRLRINVANLTEDVKDSNSNLVNTSMLYGFTYTAKFFDGVWSPNIGYHIESFKTATGTPNKKDRSYLAIGSKLAISSFELELDYLNNKNKFEVKATDDILDTRSAVTLLRYKFLEASSVHFKYEDTVQKKALNSIDSKDTKITGITFTYEFKPFKDENWRAHFAGTQKNTKLAGADTKTEKTLFVGMRLLADILK